MKKYSILTVLALFLLGSIQAQIFKKLGVDSSKAASLDKQLNSAVSSVVGGKSGLTEADIAAALLRAQVVGDVVERVVQAEHLDAVLRGT